MTRPIPPITLAAALAAGCMTPEMARQQADEDVYGILEEVSASVTGDAKTFEIGRKENTLRDRLLREGGKVFIDLNTSLDVASENSRDFASERERLYRTALTLTSRQNEFAVRWGAGGRAAYAGLGEDDTLTFRPDLSSSVRSPSGGQVFASFANTFLGSLLRGGGFDAVSLFNIGFTQPLLQGAGKVVAREPLNQAERDVVYAMRSFERSRAVLSVDVVSSYLGVLQDRQNLDSALSNQQSVAETSQLTRALYDAGRRNITDLDRTISSDLNAQDRVVNARNQLQSSLDSFKFLLGLPVDAEIELDPSVFDQLESLVNEVVDLEEDTAVLLALERRYDYRNVLDQVEDAARRILVAENGLESILDFTGAIDIPTEPGKPLKLDFSRTAWTVGFDFDLAIDRLPERNAYRSALIDLDVAMRSRDDLQDRIKQQVRNALRDIHRRYRNFQIQNESVVVSERRVDSAGELYEVGRAQSIDILDAQDDLLSAEISRTAALVDYATSRLRFLRDVEAIAMEPKGLRLDFSLPMPDDAPARTATP